MGGKNQTRLPFRNQSLDKTSQSKKREKIPRTVGKSFMETSRGLETSQKCPHEYVLGVWFPVNAFFGRFATLKECKCLLVYWLVDL